MVRVTVSFAVEEPATILRSEALTYQQPGAPYRSEDRSRILSVALDYLNFFGIAELPALVAAQFIIDKSQVAPSEKKPSVKEISQIFGLIVFSYVSALLLLSPLSATSCVV